MFREEPTECEEERLHCICLVCWLSPGGPSFLVFRNSVKTLQAKGKVSFPGKCRAVTKAFPFNNKHSKDLKLIKLFKIPRLFKLVFLKLTVNYISVGWNLTGNRDTH